MAESKETEVIVLGGGCFWCMDASYKLIKGIVKVEEGYSGGSVPNPTDQQIYYEDTGHAEVVRLTFNPKIISLKDLLDIFFTIHDPTSVNRQGPDEGKQYRSAIFYNSEAQLKVIEEEIKEVQKLWDKPIVTEVSKFNSFYLASDYHKDYETNRPDYCYTIINPKLNKLRAKFSSLLK